MIDLPQRVEGVYTSVFCLISIIYSAGGQSVPPKCEDWKDTETPLHQGMAKYIMEAFKDLKQERPKYSCKLEKMAHKLMPKPEKDGVLGKFFVTRYVSGGVPSSNDVVQYWKLKLRAMGKVARFGCNFEKTEQKHTIVCVYRRSE
ncbi:hypothetical protein Y032_0010g1149 [Ancylostoma ceylanicum]|uniref:SCP domain-containing protein n=1 Tax=Ancylostoma ceylanicum TaxID=53326 RepID=A0A016VG82_9BILA|nr:hypothetical protein Y032_0010g1149 [Ancylostoma ceylanicum]